VRNTTAKVDGPSDGAAPEWNHPDGTAEEFPAHQQRRGEDGEIRAPEATIVNTIATSDTQFDLSSAGLQALSQSGVSSKVVRAMLAAESKKKDAARTRLHRSHSRHTPQRHPHEELFM
jgi:hypothetical protein